MCCAIAVWLARKTEVANGAEGVVIEKHNTAISVGNSSSADSAVTLKALERHRNSMAYTGKAALLEKNHGRRNIVAGHLSGGKIS